MSLTIPQPLYDQLRAHGEETYPHECCGIMLGKVSAAASVTAALQVAEVEAAAGREAVIVTILCDSADKYLSERFWSDPIAADLELAAKLIPRGTHAAHI